MISCLNFRSSLLRFNLHTAKWTNLKCTAWWLFASVCTHVATRTFASSQKMSFQSISTPPHPQEMGTILTCFQNWLWLILFFTEMVSYSMYFFGLLPLNIISVRLSMLLHVSVSCPVSMMGRIPLYEYTQFAYPLFSWWALGLFLVFGCFK